MELPGAVFLILSQFHWISPCHCQFVWPGKAADVMFAAQVGGNIIYTNSVLLIVSLSNAGGNKWH